LYKSEDKIMPTLQLRGDHITLVQALKAGGLTQSGGQAKYLVREKQVLVNGAVETRPGRKLVAGDRFGLVGGTEWIVNS
jgi:ribosome-associated protein